MSETPIDKLLRLAVARELDESALASLTAEYARAQSGELLEDFAEFVSQRFAAGELSYHVASAVFNHVMPAAGWEKAPFRLWQAYIAFEDFEGIAFPDAGARERIRALLAEWNAQP